MLPWSWFQLVMVLMSWSSWYVAPHCLAASRRNHLLPQAKGPTQELSAVNAKFQGHDAYATSDLLLPHPSKAGLWKTIGRKDDIIVLSTGEKVCHYFREDNFS